MEINQQNFKESSEDQEEAILPMANQRSVSFQIVVTDKGRKDISESLY